jgi:hypothetical protein
VNQLCERRGYAKSLEKKENKNKSLFPVCHGGPRSKIKLRKEKEKPFPECQAVKKSSMSEQEEKKLIMIPKPHHPIKSRKRSFQEEGKSR